MSILDRLIGLKSGDENLQIDKLKYNFDTGARGNYFMVNIFGPQGIALEGWRCETVQIPSRELEASQWSSYGPVRNIPNNITMDGQRVPMTFLCDQHFADKFILDAWQSYIYTGTGTHKDQGNSLRPTFRYQQDYVGRVEIISMRKDGADAMKTTLHNAYPITLGAMTHNTGARDEIMKFEVTFSFETFDTEYVNAPKLSLLNKGRRVLDALLETDKLRGRFGKKVRSLDARLKKYDDRLTRISNIFG
ncbi:hypothetical protein OAW24_00695 [bacterium]|nr:hypothetical protein [bacterium]